MPKTSHEVVQLYGFCHPRFNKSFGTELVWWRVEARREKGEGVTKVRKGESGGWEAEWKRLWREGRGKKRNDKGDGITWEKLREWVKWECVGVQRDAIKSGRRWVSEVEGSNCDWTGEYRARKCYENENENDKRRKRKLFECTWKDGCSRKCS